jgi:amino acid transporter
MHTRKKETLIAFILLCVLSVAFAVATLLRPNVAFISFLVASVAGALFGAYRVFAFSDDWYRAREEKEQLWYERHPHLTALLVVLATGGCLWQVFDMLRRLFR